MNIKDFALQYYDEDQLDDVAWEMLLLVLKKFGKQVAKEQKEDILETIKEIEQDWEDFGDYDKANACAYLIGHLNAKDEPEFD